MLHPEAAGSKYHSTYHSSLGAALESLLKAAHIARLAEGSVRDLHEAIGLYREVAEKIGLVEREARERLAGQPSNSVIAAGAPNPGA